MKKFIKVSIQILISFLFLYFAFRNVDFSGVMEIAKTVNLPLLLIGVALQFCSFFLRAYRWQMLLSPMKTVNYQSSYQVLMISYAANNVIPLRAGDVLRAVLIGKKENISKVSSFSTVLLERISDGLTVLLFLFIGLSFLSSDAAFLDQIKIMSLLVFTAAIIFIVVLNVFQEKLIKFVVALVEKRSPKVSSILGSLLTNFLVAFQVVNSLAVVAKITAISLIVWSLEASLFSFGAMAFGIGWNEAVLIGIVTVAIVNLGIMIPSSPGYIGTFQFFAILSLGLFAVSPELAASYSLVVHLAQYLPITLVGLVLWLTYSIKNTTEQDKQLGVRS